MPKKSESTEETAKTKKPTKAEKPKKQKLSEKDFENKVLELTKNGLTSEKIGQQLRDQGIHPKEHNAKISKILKQNKVYTNPDIKNVTEKLERIKIHYPKNKQDKRAKREIDRVSQKLRKLKKYFKEQ